MTLTFKVAGIMETIGTKHGLNAGTDGIDDDCYGAVITSQQTYTQFLVKHKAAYNFLILDDILDGAPMIRLVRRAVNADIEVDFAITEQQCITRNTQQPAIKYSLIDPMVLPREVELQYISYDRSFAVNTQYARHEGARTQQSTYSAAVDFILADQQARDLAYDLLYRMWSQQLTVSFEHPDLTIEPSDIVQIASNQGTFVIQVLNSLIVKEPMNVTGVGRTNQLTGQLLMTRKGVSVSAGQANTVSSNGAFHTYANTTVLGVSDFSGSHTYTKALSFGSGSAVTVGRSKGTSHSKAISFNSGSGVTAAKIKNTSNSKIISLTSGSALSLLGAKTIRNAVSFTSAQLASMRRAINKLLSISSGETVTAATVASGAPLDGLSATAGWSFSRKLVSAYGGSFYTTTSGVIDAVLDQTGNTRNLSQGTAASRPTPTTAGPNSITCASFDGSNDNLHSGSNALSTFISASSGYMIATIYIDSFPTNSANAYANSVILLDAGQFAGMTVRSGNIFYAYNWDGNEDKAQGTTNASTAYVVEWRHDSGNLYQRVNGAGETTVPSGNTATVSLELVMGAVSSAGAQPFAGKIFEAATFSTVPNQTTRDSLVQKFGLYVGASV